MKTTLHQRFFFVIICTVSRNVILEKDKTAYFSRLDHLTCEVAKNVILFLLNPSNVNEACVNERRKLPFDRVASIWKLAFANFPISMTCKYKMQKDRQI